MNRYFIILFILPIFVGCSSSKEKQPESTLLRSYRLIDSDKTDDAIALLSDEIDKKDAQSKNGIDDSNEATELRVTLASAYAKKAGITIREIVQAYQMGKQLSDIKIKDNAGVYQTENDRKITEISKVVLTQLRMVQTLAVIPKVPNDKMVYLTYAMKVLNSSPHLSPADLVYSAILKLILVRTMIESDDLKGILPKVVKVDQQCVANFSEFRDYLLKATQILLSGFEDAIKAMPEKKEELMKNANDITDLSSSLASLNAAGIVAYNVNKESLRQIYTSLGVRPQEINCEAKPE